MQILMVIAGGLTGGAVLCQAIEHHYAGRPIIEGFIPPTWREFVFPMCPFCWPARASIAALVGAWLIP